MSRVSDASGKASIRSLLIADAEFRRQNRYDLYVGSLPGPRKDNALDLSANHIQSLFDAGEADIDSAHPWRTPPYTP